MKYNVGDTVKIKESLRYGDRFSVHVNETMEGLRGKQAKITKMSGRSYSIDLDGGRWCWTDDMFDDVVPTGNYLCLNGKKVELTEEQLRKLGIEPEKKNPFARAKHGETFYYIGVKGNVDSTIDFRTGLDNARFDTGNYCTDEALMKQRAMKETLSRLLWRFSTANGGTSKDDDTCYIINTKDFSVQSAFPRLCALQPSFASKDAAERAIKEVVKPFIASNSGFSW